MNNQHEIIIGQVSGVFGNSLFSVLINKRTTVKAKTRGSMTKIKKQFKSINELKKGDWVTMSELGLKMNGGVRHHIESKLSKKDKSVIYTEDENTDISRNLDMFKKEEHNEQSCENDINFDDL